MKKETFFRYTTLKSEIIALQAEIGEHKGQLENPEVFFKSVENTKDLMS